VKDIDEAKQAIRSALGNEARDTFGIFVEDFVYYIRSLAMVDLKTPNEVVRERLHNICRGIIVESIKSFLSSKHSEEDGSFGINVSNNDVICDRNMNPLPEIIAIKDMQAEIVDFLLSMAMHEFSKGRILSLDIVKRAKKFNKKGITKRKPTLPIAPAIEAIEIVIMRLERKLPDLTPDEAARLSEYYNIIRERRK
jgi:hypothetical protein